MWSITCLWLMTDFNCCFAFGGHNIFTCLWHVKTYLTGSDVVQFDHCTVYTYICVSERIYISEKCCVPVIVRIETMMENTFDYYWKKKEVNPACYSYCGSCHCLLTSLKLYHHLFERGITPPKFIFLMVRCWLLSLQSWFADASSYLTLSLPVILAHTTAPLHYTGFQEKTRLVNQFLEE